LHNKTKLVKNTNAFGKSNNGIVGSGVDLHKEVVGWSIFSGDFLN
jgi:hypothetical protein